MRVLVCLLAACAAPPRYLGAPLPDECERGEVESCAGWLAERDLVAGQLDVYADPVLQRYVQGIAARLARGTRLARPPRVVIGDHDGTYAALGERIVIGRIAIEKLASEAELAAIVAHEIVHVEARHTSVSLFGSATDATWLAARRDAEAIADERAVALLERAGYRPAAMTRALDASLQIDDEEHPPRAARLASVAALAANRTHGFEGRAEYLERVERMIVGPNTQLGVRVDDTWVIAMLGVAIELRARDVAHVDGDALVLRNGKARFSAYPIGSAWARELAAGLDERAAADTALGPLTVGIAPERKADAGERVDKLQRVVRELLPQPAPGTWIVVLERPRGGLVLEIAATTDTYTRDRWLAALRAASPSEIAAAEPPRIALRRAPFAGKVADLVLTCPDPATARGLDDPDRGVAAGELFKCTDR